MVVITMIYKFILGLQPLWLTFGQVYTLKLLGYGTVVVTDKKCLLGLLRWSCNLCSDRMAAFWWSHHTTHQEVVNCLFYSLLFEYTITFLLPFLKCGIYNLNCFNATTDCGPVSKLEVIQTPQVGDYRCSSFWVRMCEHPVRLNLGKCV